jgi:acyl transferase domain-containing protein
VGRCKSFDSSGDGYGRGEGFVAVVMQRHAGASSAGICGIVLGSAVNQAGRSSGLTAPYGPSQSALIKAALAAAGLSSTAVRFLSVHGTGTALGDPIEIGALAQALPGSSSSGRPGGQQAAPLTLASNKSCCGHTEGAAGLTGLLLAASMASQQAAPAIMHLRSMNPYVQTALSDWAARGGGRALHLPRQYAAGAAPSPQPGAAGTSSFGMSGVNAHMLVEAAPDSEHSNISAVAVSACSPPPHDP